MGWGRGGWGRTLRKHGERQEVERKKKVGKKTTSLQLGFDVRDNISPHALDKGMYVCMCVRAQ